ncbi:MAG: preprotein translocase subunit SecE [Glaciimonas sp.]|nr:preprotein translocase subunit SecE [Glaciimonas sp.]
MSNHPVQTVTTSSDKLKVALSVGAVIVGVVGFYYLSDKSTLLRAGVLFGAMLIAIGIAWTSTSGREFIGFANESVRETKKVVWPKRKQAMQMTAIVFGFVLVMAIFLWGTDKLLEFLLYDIILGWKK